jgi:hypothetical protein
MKNKIIKFTTPALLITSAFAIPIDSPISNTFNSVSSIVNWASGAILPVATIVLVGIIVYAGFLKLTSMGNPDKEKQSMQTLTSGIVGFALILSAALVVGILGALFGVKLLGIT